MSLPTQINLDDLEGVAAAWLNSRRRIAAPKTTGRRLTAVRHLALCFGKQILVGYRGPTAAPPRPHPLPGGVGDLTKMLAACATEEQVALVAMCGLIGMRIGEALDTCPERFNFVDRLVSIWGKGSKVRDVPLSDMAWQVLLPILAMRMNDPKKPIVTIGDRAARDLIKRLGKMAGVPREISSHDLRATFATEAYARTKDIRAVQILLGHASSKQTEVYVAIDDQSLRAAANIMAA